MTNQKAFTLVDLLVVITIITLLLTIRGQVATVAKQQAAGVVCLNNQKALIMAWSQYAEENDSNLVGGNVSGPQSGGYAYANWLGSLPTWCLEPTVTSSMPTSPIRASTTIVTQEDRFYGIRLGKLYPYTKNVEAYHCPGDKSILSTPPFDKYRSYSITGMMNGEDDPVNHPSQKKKAYRKTGEIKGPSNKMVFIEECSPNQYWLFGSWVLNLNNSLDPPYFWDILAIWHDQKSSLSFADGHVQMKQWTDPRTLELATLPRAQVDSMKQPYSINNPDFDFLYNTYGGILK